LKGTNKTAVGTGAKIAGLFIRSKNNTVFLQLVIIYALVDGLLNPSGVVPWGFFVCGLLIIDTRLSIRFKVIKLKRLPLAAL